MIIDPATFRLTQRPAFVVFEGINGCGKTTLLRSVSLALQRQNETVCETREPGGTALGVELRRLLLEWGGEKKSDRSELLLFAADRAEHIEKVVRPQLKKGSTVLCDRFIHSTIAFQGYGRGLDRQLLEDSNRLAVGGVAPHLVVLIDIDVRVALKRAARRRGEEKDSFEAENIAFHDRIRSGFLEIAHDAPELFLVLDGTATPEELLRQTVAILIA